MRSDRTAALLTGGVAIALLAGAYGFQYLGNLAPCEMCWWQRYALMATAALAGLALATRSRGLAAASIAALFVNAGIAAFHVGVEQHWWQGITACAAPMVTGTTADVIGQMMAQPLVRCDAIAWSLFGISMAGWNALVSTAIGGAALWRLTR
jgi:disulfide bond formation protein DsbB